jgi:OmpA-OmpF porin, OOP family
MTMNKSKAVLATLGFATATAFAGSALAQTQETGFYAGLAIGQSGVEDFCGGTSSCEDTDTAFKIFGGYQFNRYLAAEIAYTDLGKVSSSGTVFGIGFSDEFKTTAFEAVAVGSYPIGTSGFAPYGKIGIYYGETKFNLNISGFGSSSVKETTTDLTYGLGVRYDFHRNFAVRAEWQRYSSVGGGDIGESDVDMISIGAAYKF